MVLQSSQNIKSIFKCVFPLFSSNSTFLFIDFWCCEQLFLLRTSLRNTFSGNEKRFCLDLQDHRHLIHISRIHVKRFKWLTLSPSTSLRSYLLNSQCQKTNKKSATHFENDEEMLSPTYVYHHWHSYLYDQTTSDLAIQEFFHQLIEIPTWYPFSSTPRIAHAHPRIQALNRLWERDALLD